MPLLPTESLLPLGLMVLLLLTASLFGLSALGHFPRATRQDALLRGVGPIVLWGSIGVVSMSSTAGIIAALSLVPWYAAIIGGGCAILIAPLTLQFFSDRFVDGPSALLSFSLLSLGFAIALAGDFLF